MEVVFNTSSQNVCQISAFSAGRSINHDGCGSKTRTNRCGHVSIKGGMHRCSRAGGAAATGAAIGWRRGESST